MRKAALLSRGTMEGKTRYNHAMRLLTQKQELFIAEYLIDGNGKRAAISAGYSPRTADKQASQLLDHPRIAAKIGAKLLKRMDRLEITADRVLQELAKLAFYDPGALLESDGSMKQIKDIDDVTRMAVAGLEVTELFEGTGDQKHAYGLCKKIKLADKGQNLERLGKHLKLFTDKTEVTGVDGGPIVVRSLNDFYAGLAEKK
jgi:phage terminase small subunit